MLIYNTFDKAFTTDPQSFTNPKGLYNYFKTLYDLYKEGGNEVTMEKLFDKYEEHKLLRIWHARLETFSSTHLF